MQIIFSYINIDYTYSIVISQSIYANAALAIPKMTKKKSAIKSKIPRKPNI